MCNKSAEQSTDDVDDADVDHDDGGHIDYMCLLAIIPFCARSTEIAAAGVFRLLCSPLSHRGVRLTIAMSRNKV